jgi:signal transduction histidine kinase
VREGVSNAVRHGAAHTIVVTVSADDDVLAVDVTDDGVGIPETVARSGLVNLAARARALGGDADVGRRPSGPGTRLTWWVPFDAHQVATDRG